MCRGLPLIWGCSCFWLVVFDGGELSRYQAEETHFDSKQPAISGKPGQELVLQRAFVFQMRTEKNDENKVERDAGDLRPVEEANRQVLVGREKGVTRLWIWKSETRLQVG